MFWVYEIVFNPRTGRANRILKGKYRTKKEAENRKKKMVEDKPYRYLEENIRIIERY